MGWRSEEGAEVADGEWRVVTEETTFLDVRCHASLDNDVKIVSCAEKAVWSLQIRFTHIFQKYIRNTREKHPQKYPFF